MDVGKLKAQFRDKKIRQRDENKSQCFCCWFLLLALSHMASRGLSGCRGHTNMNRAFRRRAAMPEAAPRHHLSAFYICCLCHRIGSPRHLHLRQVSASLALHNRSRAGTEPLTSAFTFNALDRRDRAIVT